MDPKRKALISQLRFARAFAAEKLPWFAPALFRCQIHFTKRIAVAAIDIHYNLYFNPDTMEVIEKKGTTKEVLAQLGFLWVHEISHVLREHGERAKVLNADPFLWNVAADLEINDSQWPDLTMPIDFPGLHPRQYQLPTGKLAEFYYRKILSEKENSLPDLVHDEGSGVHGSPRPWESGNSNIRQLNPLERVLIKKAVAEEMHKNEVPSNIPGNWLKWAEEQLESRINWRHVLRHRMTIATNQGIGSRIDYSFARPSRRQSVYHPVLSPSLRGDVSANIAVIVDTSGSMGPKEISQAVAEVCEILQSFHAPVTVIPCDSRTYEPISLSTPGERFKLKQLKGGGGTNMIAGIEAALKLRPSPDSILVLTDSFTPYPRKKYHIPVVFGLIKFREGTKLLRPPDPPWGIDSTVVIDMTSMGST